ncbi:beta-ribofuranosylaminobenzene 5'-phosphate synthase [Methanocaldococcus infernus]
MKIISPSRIHMGLIDLNGSIGRVDGGVGLALEKPSLEIEGKEDEDIVIECDNENIKRRAYKVASTILNHIGERGVYLKINSYFPQHSGLGSGTQIALSVGTLIAKIYGRELDPYEIAKLTGRGGTSGIGIGAFKYGGFLIDGGHSFKEKGSFKPSSASLGVKPAPIIFRHDFPWDLILIIPEGKHVHGQKEVDIFKKYCPIPLEEVRELCHLILMKLMPSIVEKNFEDFGEVINRMQFLGFKRVELELQSEVVKDLIINLQSVAYSGLSSFGPTVYAFGDKKEIVSIAKEILDKFQISGNIIETRANNEGYKIC